MPGASGLLYPGLLSSQSAVPGIRVSYPTGAVWRKWGCVADLNFSNFNDSLKDLHENEG